MKKIFLAAALAALVLTSVNAQEKYKPDAMTVSTELSYSPGGATDGGFSLPEYGAKVRLHLNEKMAVRLKLGLNTSSQKTTDFTPNGTNDDIETYHRNTQTIFSIMPGFEYHFTKYERISPYVGGEIGLLSSTTKETTSSSISENKTIIKNPGLGFGINVFTGVDVYLCKGLYLGFELGLGYESLDTKRTLTTTISENGTTEDKGNQAILQTSFGFHATPSLRVGWCF
ncbi:outer membrane beta-barrel protein [Barnesiella sp. ET7]|uniref:outer membrane beta-barrel protein n=1 Tax=Barnesiella sp. ET7 TaxID=2972460 RepID=UPI0021AC1A5C|nr:outer membrane beta-barrel protein [Barnesiella sp. ET7]MCR8911769.1 outer membrane beta-barrel protein [Barnesiella sp. ET7]